VKKRKERERRERWKKWQEGLFFFFVVLQAVLFRYERWGTNVSRIVFGERQLFDSAIFCFVFVFLGFQSSGASERSSAAATTSTLPAVAPLASAPRLPPHSPRQPHRTTSRGGAPDSRRSCSASASRAATSWPPRREQSGPTQTAKAGAGGEEGAAWTSPSPDSTEGAESEEEEGEGNETEPERVCMTVRAAASESNAAEEEEGDEEAVAAVDVSPSTLAAPCISEPLCRRFCLLPRRDSDTAIVATSSSWFSPFSPSSSESDSEEEEDEEDEEELSSETAAEIGRRRFIFFADFFAALAAAFSAAFRASGPPDETSSKSRASSGAATGISEAAEGTAEAEALSCRGRPPQGTRAEIAPRQGAGATSGRA